MQSPARIVPLMEHDPRRWINALRMSHDALVSRVKTLSPEQLKAQSYCSDWDVSQVIAHLGSGAEISLVGLERAVDGRPSLSREDFPAIWDRWNHLAPEERTSEMVVWDRRAVAVAESLDDETLASLHATFFGMELKAADMIGLRLGEHALHSWDIAVTFDDKAELMPEVAALLVDRVPGVAGRTGKADVEGSPKRVDVRVNSPARRMLLTIGDKVTLEPGSDGSTPDGTVDGTLTLPAAALVRLAYGRLDAEHTPAGVVTDGDVTLEYLRRVFPGF